jgi:hypothetical protein
VSDLSDKIEETLPMLPEELTGHPAYVWIILHYCKKELEKTDPEDRYSAMQIAVVVSTAIAKWIELASEEIANERKH